MAEPPTPWARTRTSSPPSASTASATARPACVGVAGIAWHGERVPAVRRDLGGGALERLGAAPHQGDRATLGGEVVCDRGADPGAAAGDEGCARAGHARELTTIVLGVRGAPGAHLHVVPAPGRAPGVSGAALGGAGARRAALHRHPPGLRALVQGDAARGGAAPALARERRHGHGARRDEADPDGAEDGRRPGRRPRDDDAARIRELPRPARARQRVPVGAVPRARGRARPAGPERPRRPPARARP